MRVRYISGAGLPVLRRRERVAVEPERPLDISPPTLITG